MVCAAFSLVTGCCRRITVLKVVHTVLLPRMRAIGHSINSEPLTPPEACSIRQISSTNLQFSLLQPHFIASRRPRLLECPIKLSCAPPLVSFRAARAIKDVRLFLSISSVTRLPS